jgi:hypothetical protein
MVVVLRLEVMGKFLSCNAHFVVLIDCICRNQLKIYHSDSRGLRSVELPRISSLEDGMNYDSRSGTDSMESEMNRMHISQSATSHNGVTGDILTGANNNSNHPVNYDINFEEKVLLCAWHPSNNTLAVAGRTGLCLYKA